MHIIIDGYNLIRQSVSLKRAEQLRGLEEGRRALLRFLAPYAASRDHRLTVVFDGWKQGGPVEGRDREGPLDIIYSRRGEKADDLIARLVESASEEVLVVSSDRAVTSFAERRGATAISSARFEKIVASTLETRNSDEEGAWTEAESDTDEDDRDRSKKGPARRLSKKEKAYQRRVGKL